MQSGNMQTLSPSLLSLTSEVLASSATTWLGHLSTLTAAVAPGGTVLGEQGNGVQSEPLGSGGDDVAEPASSPLSVPLPMHDKLASWWGAASGLRCWRQCSSIWRLSWRAPPCLPFGRPSGRCRRAAAAGDNEALEQHLVQGLAGLCRVVEAHCSALQQLAGGVAAALQHHYQQQALLLRIHTCTLRPAVCALMVEAAPPAPRSWPSRHSSPHMPAPTRQPDRTALPLQLLLPLPALAASRAVPGHRQRPAGGDGGVQRVGASPALLQLKLRQLAEALAPAEQQEEQLQQQQQQQQQQQHTCWRRRTRGREAHITCVCECQTPPPPRHRPPRTVGSGGRLTWRGMGAETGTSPHGPTHAAGGPPEAGVSSSISGAGRGPGAPAATGMRLPIRGSAGAGERGGGGVRGGEPPRGGTAQAIGVGSVRQRGTEEGMLAVWRLRLSYVVLWTLGRLRIRSCLAPGVPAGGGPGGVLAPHQRAGSLLHAVAQPIRDYLRGRSDTIKCLVTLMTQTPTSASSVQQPPSPPPASQASDLCRRTKSPPPGVLPGARLAAAAAGAHRPPTRLQDVASLLTEVFGSLRGVDCRVQESGGGATRLRHGVWCAVTAREVRTVKLLKMRFDEAAMHGCEVMLKDVVLLPGGAAAAAAALRHHLLNTWPPCAPCAKSNPAGVEAAIAAHAAEQQQ